MLSFPSPSPKHQSKDKGEWTVLTYDVDRPCVICLHYLHRGQAQTLAEVFPLHGLGPQGEVFPPKTTIANTLERMMSILR